MKKAGLGLTGKYDVSRTRLHPITRVLWTMLVAVFILMCRSLINVNVECWGEYLFRPSIIFYF